MAASERRLGNAPRRELDGGVVVKRIPLRNRAGETVAHALVDDEDYEGLTAWRWSHFNSTYASRGETRKTNGKVTWSRTHLMHRQVLGLKHGDRQEGDHINGNGLDNRRSNLRVVTKAQNAENQQRKRKGTSSKYRGVCWDTAQGSWLAYANPKTGFRNLGHFADEDEAGRASADWRRENKPFSPEARGAAK